MRHIAVLACAGVILAGCAGREPAPVSAYLPNDPQLSCGSIDAEIRGNNEAIRTRVNEDAEVQNKNIVVGTAGALLFFPIALAMDFKGAAMTEASAFEQRNRTLAGLATHTRCNAARPVTVAEATQEREAALAAAKAAEMNDVPGVKNPSDQRLQPAPVMSPPAGLPAAASTAPWPGSGPAPMQPAVTQAQAGPARSGDSPPLQQLMDRFLRGEISKAEYDRLRAGG